MRVRAAGLHALYSTQLFNKSVMFHPNWSNRGKANFVVGVVVLVSLFWLLGSWNSRSSRSSKEDQIASETGGDFIKQDRNTGRVRSSKMASDDRVVELNRDTDLLSPPLPEEIERRKEAMDRPSSNTLDVDVSTVQAVCKLCSQYLVSFPVPPTKAGYE